MVKSRDTFAGALIGPHGEADGRVSDQGEGGSEVEADCRNVRSLLGETANDKAHVGFVVPQIPPAPVLGLREGGMCGPEGTGGQMFVSVSSHMAAVSSAFLQSFLLIHPLSLACNEGQPQWGGASYSAGPSLQLRCPGCKAWGRGNGTRDSTLLNTSPALHH